MIYKKTKLVDEQRQELVRVINNIDDSVFALDDVDKADELREYAETLLKGFDMAVAGFVPVKNEEILDK
ncbi:hypothetical protein D3P96_02890 [Weissella viridescens]|uniref:Uncharacterized protein n=1 Tax=Weissella viridescens TaxID=1629 RepID=A0A3P2RG56_WEIVI|nr:hypothetical protein [Weissella viridescens]RRG18251.1 hypothetical protein D3P96_02890 [Weissella viridescens]